MPIDTRIQDAIAQIASERSLTPSQARRYLIEQIDLARRKSVTQPHSMNRTVTKVHIANPCRIFVEPQASEPRSDFIQTHEIPKDKPVILDPGKSPVPGSETSLIYGIIRDAISFQDAENTLAAMQRYSGVARSTIRGKMVRVCNNYGLRRNRFAPSHADHSASTSDSQPA